jgi:CRP/FNR family cyclic AMP-dependent transcriptional regulator
MTKFNSQFNNDTVQLLAGYKSLSNGSTGSQDTLSSSVATTHLSSVIGLPASYEVLTFSEGETLYKEGEKPKGVYVLKSGCVKIFVNRDAARGRTTSPEYVTKLVSPEEVFGYKAIVTGTETKSFAKAIKTSTVWLYSLDVMKQLISQVNPMVQQIMQQSVSDLQNYEKMSQLHYLASVQERIAYQIVTLADRFGVRTPEGISLNLKLTRNEFAQLASTINESLSRHLTEFKNEGLIDINGKEIIILNREALAAKSGQISI